MILAAALKYNSEWKDSEIHHDIAEWLRQAGVRWKREEKKVNVISTYIILLANYLKDLVAFYIIFPCHFIRIGLCLECFFLLVALLNVNHIDVSISTKILFNLIPHLPLIENFKKF